METAEKSILKLFITENYELVKGQRALSKGKQISQLRRSRIKNSATN